MRCVDLLEATTPSVGREVNAWETLEKTCGVIHDGGDDDGDDDDDDDDGGDDCDDSDDDGNYQNRLSCVSDIKYQNYRLLCLHEELFKKQNNSVANY